MHICAASHSPLHIDDGRRPFHARRGWTALHPRKAVNTIVVRQLLVAVHGHALTVPAKLTVGGWGDGTRRVAANSGALLERKQLLGTEGFVVDLGSGFDEVLEVGASKEVAQIDELAVVLILDFDLLVDKCTVWEMNIPLMTPHLVWRPRTFCPLTTTVFSEPMTAKGIRSCHVSVLPSSWF